MYRSYCLLLSVIVILFVGCNNNKKNTKITEHTNKTIEVKNGKTLLCDDFYGNMFVALKDSTFIMESYGALLFETYKIKADSLKRDKGFVSKGQGPNEFNVPARYYDTETNKLYLFEHYTGLGNGCIIDMNSDDYDNSRKWKNFSLKWMQSFFGGMSFIAENDNEFLLLGGAIDESSLLSKVSISNKKITPLDFWYKNPYLNNTRVTQFLFVDNAHIFKNKTNGKILYCGGNGKVVSLFKIKNNKVDSLTHIYNEVSPNRTDDGLNFRLTDNENWQIFAKTTDKFFFLRPYKYDKKYTKYKEYPFYYSDKLEVYDWNGKHIINMEFDTPFYDFIIDDSNTTIFTLTSDLKTDDIIVKKYDISKML